MQLKKTPNQRTAPCHGGFYVPCNYCKQSCFSFGSKSQKSPGQVCRWPVWEVLVMVTWARCPGQLSRSTSLNLSAVSAELVSITQTLKMWPSCTLHPTASTLHPTGLHPTPYSKHPIPYRPTPYSKHYTRANVRRGAQGFSGRNAEPSQVINQARHQPRRSCPRPCCC